MKRSIGEILAKKDSLFGKDLVVNGWVRTIRRGKNNAFVLINDGTSLFSLQLFFSQLLLFQQKEKIDQITIGCALEVNGTLVNTLLREQPFELQVNKVVNLFPSSSNYPIQKKSLPLSFIRNFPQFRAKTNFFLSLSRIRSRVSFLINSFFQKNDFLYVNTPIITANDAEGGSQSFQILSKNNENFFLKTARLTVSGQLHAESLSQGLGKVYNFSPCFRAENSNTSRHLAEFWMVEAESSFSNLKEIISYSQKLLKFIFKELINRNREDLLFFEKFSCEEIISKLHSIITKNFPVITYQKAIKIIIEKAKEDNNFFIFKDISWGSDLNSEHEKYLCEYFNSPIFVINYPKKIKAFYMKENSDQKTVSCMDLLLPRIGELIGGSVRENNYYLINKRIIEEKLVTELQWYSNLRKEGYAPSAGFGMGLERLLMFITGIENIRDVIPFPRSSKELEF